MEALQLPLLHSTPRKGAVPSKMFTTSPCDPESNPNKGIHLTVPRSPRFVHSADVPRIQIQREIGEVGEMELDKSDSFDTGMDPDFYSRL